MSGLPPLKAATNVTALPTTSVALAGKVSLTKLGVKGVASGGLKLRLSRNTVLSPPFKLVPAKVSVCAAAEAVKLAE